MLREIERRDRPLGLSTNKAMQPKLLKERRSSPRINGFDYKGIYAYSITCCTKDDKNLFISGDPFHLVFDILLSDAKEERFLVHTYCFMPDHLHLLLFGEDEDSSLLSMMKRFKQRSDYYFKKRFGMKLWQRSYYDHALRKEEDIEIVARYILGNPVRKGLVEDFRKYPYSGSVVTF